MNKMILTFLFLIPNSFSFAQNGPCKADVEKLCAGVPMGGGAIHKCLKEKEAQLSPECKMHKEKMKTMMGNLKEACQADMEANCGDAKHGRGEIMKCMHKNMEKLSAECKAEMSGMRDLRKNK